MGGASIYILPCPCWFTVVITSQSLGSAPLYFEVCCLKAFPAQIILKEGSSGTMLQASLEESPLLLDHCFFQHVVAQEGVYITLEKRNESNQKLIVLDSAFLSQQEWKNWILWQKNQLDMLEENVDQCIADDERTARIASGDIVKNSLSADEDSAWAAPSESSEEEDASEEERESRKRKEEEAAEKLKKRKKRKKRNFKKAEEESEEPPEVWLHQEFPYAQQWLEQGGDDLGIPKQYTPCKSYFHAKEHGCLKGNKCEFSHNEEIFLNDPFAACLKDLHQGSKKRKKRKKQASPSRGRGAMK